MNAVEQAEHDERQRTKEKVGKLQASNFKQQRLSSWRPQQTDKSNIITFALFGIIFLAIGGTLFQMSNAIFEQVLRYDEVCNDKLQSGKTCIVDMKELMVDVKGPFYVYYQLDNFFQNHRRFVKSRDHAQLNGEMKTVKELTDCDPIQKVSDLYSNQQKSVNGKALSADSPAVPCGLNAKSLFNDTFVLKWGTTAVPINEKNIAWQVDRDHRFSNTDGDWESVQWTDMENEHFIVWMRTAGLSTFRKLWGKIEEDLKTGDYTFEVQNNYEVRPFQGKKSIVIATSNVLGGRNYFLAMSFLVVGGASFAFSILCCLCSCGKSKQN